MLNLVKPASGEIAAKYRYRPLFVGFSCRFVSFLDFRLTKMPDFCSQRACFGPATA
jgi:hypothetical protein